MTVTSRPADPVPPGDEEEPGDLGRRVSRGLGWSLLGQLLSRIGVFTAGIVLARLLLPADFGEVAAALVVVNVVLAINELGVIPALVRWQGDLRVASATAATIAMANSVFVYLVAFVAAPHVADLANTPGATWVIRIMALSVLVDGLIAVPLALLYRQLRTVAQVVAEVVGMAVFAGTAVVLADAGVGAHSMAWARLLGAVATGGLILAVSRWPSRPGFDRRIAGQLLRFGAPLAISQSVLEGVMTVDYLIVGRELTGAALGVYLLAFNLSSWPVSVVSVAVARVSFAGYSSLLGDQARLARGFVQSMAVALSVTLPMVLLLVVLAPELVAVFYGAPWADAVDPLRWLLVVGGLRVLLQLVGEVVAVVGRSLAVLRMRVLWLLVLPLPLVYGARSRGLEGVGMAHVAVALVIIVPICLHELRVTGIPLGLLARAGLRPALAGIAALAVMGVVGPVVHGDLTRLVLIGGAGGIAYLVALIPANPVVTTTLTQLRGGGGERS